MNEKIKSHSAEYGNETSLWDILKLLLRKLHWIILAGLLAAGLIYLAVSLLITPTYKSRVSFYVSNSVNGSSQSGTINNNDLQAAETLATTYSKILASNSVLDAVLNDLNAGSDFSRKTLSDMVEVSVVSNTQLLEVAVTSTDPKFACEIADSFAKVVSTEITRITKAGAVEVVDQPEVATEKSAPRTVFDSVIGFAIGVIIASAVVVLKALADTTIYLPEDIESVTGITVLGQIPDIEAANSDYVYWTLTEGGAVRYESKEKQGS